MSGAGDEKRSALKVVPGVEGGHDGLPGRRPPESVRPRRRELSADEYIEGILSGDRVCLARAITLVESNAPGHQALAQDVLRQVLPRAGDSLRLGITGVPGAGKSTLIETLGTHLTAKGMKVAVTAVDPSSTRTGGSILGDKTRMERLAANPSAFIRPSPSGGVLGGVARRTRETIVLFEAAGYDVILVETVGVGQSEITVRSMVDFFLLVLVAGAGDELQGIKRGVVEIADAILVHKADGDNVVAAAVARGEYERALHYLQPATVGWQTRAVTASSLTGEGIPELWQMIGEFRESATRSGAFDERRRGQERDWMVAMVRERLWELFRCHPEVRRRLPDLENRVMAGELPAAAAAEDLLAVFETPDQSRS
jgi:LAO/AO transport system kinase